MDTYLNTIGIDSPCTISDDCQRRIRNSECSKKSVCVCKDEHKYLKSKNECVKVKIYGEKCTLLEPCNEDYLVCADLGVCVCSPGYIFSPKEKPFCYPNSTFKSCEYGFLWSQRRQRCMRAHGQRGDMDVWIHDHHSMIRPRYSFFTFTILIICLMIILKRRSRKPTALGSFPRIYNQSIVANEINLNQLRSPVLISSSHCYTSRQNQRARDTNYPRDANGDGDYHSHNTQPPPPYEETETRFTRGNDTVVNASADAPPSYEQAIQMQPLSQPTGKDNCSSTSPDVNLPFTDNSNSNGNGNDISNNNNNGDNISGNSNLNDNQSITIQMYPTPPSTSSSCTANANVTPPAPPSTANQSNTYR